MERRDKDEATGKILQMSVDGKRNGGRPKLRNQMPTEMAEEKSLACHDPSRNTIEV